MNNSKPQTNKALRVSHFGPIQSVDLAIKGVNIIIGETATGKSLIAKLVFLFLDSVSDIRLIRLEKEHLDPQRLRRIVSDKFIEGIRRRFHSILGHSFSRFLIEFDHGNSKIVKISSSKGKLQVILSKEIDYAIEDASRKTVERFRDFGESNPNYRILHPVYLNAFRRALEFEQADFIPASRVSYTILSENLFGLIRDNRSIIDHLTASFAQSYQFQKENFGSRGYRRFIARDDVWELVSILLRGEYRYIRGQERFYISPKRYIDLTKLSSGQQELLPALAVLCGMLEPWVEGVRSTVVIEEPEAHLFPEDQKRLVELLALVKNATGDQRRLIITTHSPYVLSSFNNLIQAHNTAISKPEAAKRVEKIVPKRKWLPFDDLNALMMIEGQAIDLLDQESRLIRQTEIDKTSEHIAQEFDSLLEIEYGS